MSSAFQAPSLAIKGKTVALERPIVIGRDTACDIFIDDDVLSRRHACLVYTPLGCHIVDLNSSNGTFVNRERVQVQHLVHGDRLTLGGLEVVLSDRRHTVRWESTGATRGLPCLRIRLSDVEARIEGAEGEGTEDVPLLEATDGVELWHIVYPKNVG